MRKKRLAYNTISALIYQIVTIICGFILPRLILGQYGSNVNGLVNSITQFLQIIAFLELGVGAVVQSALYKPLADLDNDAISKVISSANNFFSKLAIILFSYIVLLLIVYPGFVKDSFSGYYTAFLIVAMAVSSFSQYFFGITDRLLLNADQRGYIQYNAQTATVILNTVACAYFISIGSSIQTVKLTTSIIYLLRPIAIRLYVRKHYHINKKIKYAGEPLKQKWNGVAQHIASVVLDDTDSIVLTVFSTLANVSIYSVYNLVVYGVKTLFTTLCSGIQSYWGDMWARDEKETLEDSFTWIEWIIHTTVVFVFGCTGVLIVPFILVYTSGVSDANYAVPIFATLITLANAVHCLRLPYHILIKSVGHYKQTQKNYIIAAIMNLLISIAFVKVWGLVGVAIGTLCAMLYQTMWMENYNSAIILKRKKNTFLKQVLIDVLTSVVGIVLTRGYSLVTLSYTSWILLAIKTAIVWVLLICVVNCIFYKRYLSIALNKLKYTILKNH